MAPGLFKGVTSERLIARCYSSVRDLSHLLGGGGGGVVYGSGAWELKVYEWHTHCLSSLIRSPHFCERTPLSLRVIIIVMNSSINVQAIHTDVSLYFLQDQALIPIWTD